MTSRRIAAIASAVAIIAGGVGIGLAASSGPACATAAQIASGGTYDLRGCVVDVGTGIRVRSPLTLTGGVLTGTTNQAARPVLRIDRTTASISGLTIQGTNTTGHIVYAANQAGIELLGTHGVSITDTNVSKTGGDCLEVFTYPPDHTGPNTDVTVNGGTYDQCGRDGISPSDVSNSLFSNLTIKQVGQSGIDAESDVGSGMGNVDFQGLTIQQRGVVVSENLTGPVTFTGDSIAGRFLWTAKHAQNFPVVVLDGTFQAGLRARPAIVVQNQPTNLTFSGETFTRPGGGQAPLWSATNGSHLTFLSSTLPAPLGSNDLTSTVTISP